jgi:hypothetical protein
MKSAYEVQSNTEDRIEFLARLSVWVALGTCSYAWFVKDAFLWRWSLFVLLVLTAIAVDTMSQWVRDEDFLNFEDRHLLNVASCARLVAWISWGVGILYTPLPLFEICWVLGGVCWGLNAILIMFYAFDEKFSYFFKSGSGLDEDIKLRKARAVFRLIIHDVVGAALVCVLGATIGDVFDGDTDDSHWRSMLSGAIIFQIFYTFWSHWGDLHVNQNIRCCHEDMWVVWKTVSRFICFFTLFIVILIRAHEDVILVDMGMNLVSLIFTLLACGILAVTNILSNVR